MLRARDAMDRDYAKPLDIDRFNAVNDTLGQAIGDEVLVAVARRLEGMTRHASVHAAGVVIAPRTTNGKS